MQSRSDELPINYRLGMEIGALKEAQSRTDVRLTAVEDSLQTLTWRISSTRPPTTATAAATATKSATPPGAPAATATISREPEWWRQTPQYGHTVLRWLLPRLVEGGLKFLFGIMLPVLTAIGGMMPKQLQGILQAIGHLFF